MTFERRRIDLKFQLGTGSFGNDGNDTVDFKGLRCSVTINVTGGMQMASADIRVFGMPLEVMHKLTILNTLNYTQGRFNTVAISAGTSDKVALCFTGGISEAWIDAKGQPDVAFHVAAHAGLIDTLKPVDPTSFKGSVDVATVLTGIAAKMTPPRIFEGNGVSIQIADPYLPGTAADQIKAIVRAAKITVVDDGQTLAIYPDNGNRSSLGAVDISPETGLVGYPAFSQNSIDAMMLFNAAVQCGMQANMKSQLPTATGKFNIYKLSHTLDSEIPDGPWFTNVAMNVPGQEAPIPTS